MGLERVRSGGSFFLSLPRFRSAKRAAQSTLCGAAPGIGSAGLRTVHTSTSTSTSTYSAHLPRATLDIGRAGINWASLQRLFVYWRLLICRDQCCAFACLLTAEYLVPALHRHTGTPRHRSRPRYGCIQLCRSLGDAPAVLLHDVHVHADVSALATRPGEGREGPRGGAGPGRYWPESQDAVPLPVDSPEGRACGSGGL